MLWFAVNELVTSSGPVVITDHLSSRQAQETWQLGSTVIEGKVSIEEGLALKVQSGILVVRPARVPPDRLGY